MSRNESEFGTIIIPSAEWAGVKKAIRDAHNRYREDVYSLALELHGALHGPRYKGRRNVRYLGDYGSALEAEVKPKFQAARTEAQIERVFMAGYLVSYQAGIHESGLSREECEMIAFRRPPKPQRKTLDRLIPAATNKTLAFSSGDLYVSLDDEQRTLTWRVDRNNHACRRARESTLGAAVFKALAAVKWTRGSGGKIIGNDEYNIDAGAGIEGGGGGYVTKAFGPGRKEEKVAWVRTVGW
ncbi:hypothetical protein J2T57_001399 [Natronocella acetinitrilica]|uniref:Uncharacterized protein n=1 Tax=Natronocella acetinitrilica TaxID=414046 RepID=A0AAE3G2M8_9GAMM|nr:hypothetical protein [Natronocella acetinitrilica]MCP1674297.1 hypothetical protein [Natronocella acetinitrilica]